MNVKIKKEPNTENCSLSVSDFFDSSDGNSTECSFHSSPEEIFSFDDSDISDEIHIKKKKKTVKKKLVTGSNSFKRNIESKRITSSQSKIQEQRNIDTVNVNTRTKKNNGATIERQKITSGGSKERDISEIKRAASEPKITMSNNYLIRARLPIIGTKKKKIFTLKVSQLLALVKKKNHPLYKWADSLTLENFKYFSINETKVMVKILSDCICAKAVPK